MVVSFKPGNSQNIALHGFLAARIQPYFSTVKLSGSCVLMNEFPLPVYNDMWNKQSLFYLSLLLERRVIEGTKCFPPAYGILHTSSFSSSFLLFLAATRVPLVELCNLYLLACLVRVTVDDSGLCCCVCVTYF